MLILAFDTATRVATSALVDDGEVLGERVSRALTVLEDDFRRLPQLLDPTDGPAPGPRLAAAEPTVQLGLF